MKAVLETSAYLLIMAVICFISLDFVFMNMSITEAAETEQYIEDYIEVYAKINADNGIDATTLETVNNYAESKGMQFSYIYETSTDTYAYYRIELKYMLNERLFKLNKTHTYDGLVRIPLESVNEI